MNRKHKNVNAEFVRTLQYLTKNVVLQSHNFHFSNDVNVFKITRIDSLVFLFNPTRKRCHALDLKGFQF